MDKEEKQNDGIAFEEHRIRWENIIFVTFNPIFRLVVTFFVIVKAYMGPLNAIRSEIVCEEGVGFVEMLRFAYRFAANPIYLVDIILYIAHRQVRETAVRREYLPKHAGLLFVDIIAFIPFVDIQVGNICTAPVHVWPHILAFSEFVLIYRVVEYFDLVKSHKLLQNLLGFAIILFLCLNCLKCWWYLVTTQGRCIECNYHNKNETAVKDDWRHAFQLIETKTNFQHHAFHYIATTFFGTSSGLIASSAYTRLLTTAGQSLILILSFAVKVLLLTPKFFTEALLGYRHIYYFQSRVATILTVAKRRTPNLKVYKDIEKFYQIMWLKRSGTLTVPKIIYELPKYLIVEVKEDLFWPVFYHSPTFRRTTAPFKRWLSGTVRLEFKMPGDKLHSGLSQGNLYYIKTGIVQILSSDDNVTPILSITGGTVIGDISFILPALKHKVTARCITYCEIHYISREDILRSLHLFPDDRRMIMQRAKERIKHARQLYSLKDSVEGLDRSENEGIAWLKRRWWQLRQLHLESESSTKEHGVELPPEENTYHCSKYIGQLVLFSEAHLHNRSIFFTTNFPWVLAPDSMFLLIWHVIVKTNVILVLFLYPPILRNLGPKLGMSFIAFQFWTDFIYIADIFISFFVYVKKDENPTSLVTMVLDRLKTRKFFLDVLSTCLLQSFIVYMGEPKYHQLFQYTRLLKLHIFFEKTHFDRKDFKTDPLIRISVKCLILVFSYIYIGAFLILLLTQYFEGLRPDFFFCTFYDKYFEEYDGKPNFFRVIKVFLVSVPLSLCIGETAEEIYLMVLVIALGYFIVLYVNGHMMTALYFRNRNIIDFQYTTFNLIREYIHYSIHPNLMKRLHKYILCHWKSATHVHNLKDEPYSVHHIIHDQIAQKIIQNSRALSGADRGLIKEIAHKARFMIIPQNSTLFLLGMQCDIVSWCVNGTINSQYSDINGNEILMEYPLGELISTGSVFFGNIAVRTFIAVTDCEIMYLTSSVFWDILKRYPAELEQIRICQREVIPVHEMLLSKYIFKNMDYRRKLLEKRHKSCEVSSLHPLAKREKINVAFLKRLWAKFYIKPNSKFTKRWMGFRTVTIVLSILSWSNQGGLGAPYRGQLCYVGYVSDFITAVDMLMKFFMGYFNEKGIIIYDKKMCIMNYLTRNFFVDLIGLLPWYKLVGEHFTSSQNLLVMTLSRCCHLYIFTGYFNFIGNRPDGKYVTMMLIKFQMIGLLIIMLCTQVEMVRCIDIVWSPHYLLLNMTLKDPLCWREKTAGAELTTKEFRVFFSHSLLDSQGAFLRTVEGIQQMIHLNPLLFMVSTIANIVYWLIFISCASLLLSLFKGNSMYEDEIKQLKLFLVGERVEKQLIKRSIGYFSYMRFRTHGVGMEAQHATDKYGFILKQDIAYYFFRKTFAELAKLIGLSPNTRKVLAVSSESLYFEGGEDIMREMDVVPHIYIIHRGKVVISKSNKVIAHLTKGSIFGQLWGTKTRPVKVTARTDHCGADLLAIPVKTFQEVITDQTKMNIVYFDEAELDYIPTSELTKENPYNSIEYLVKGSKTIKLPWMASPISARKSKWYANWLLVTWLFEPALSTALSLLYILKLDDSTKLHFFIVLIHLDIIHVTYAISDFLYTLNLSVEDDKCILTKRRYQRRQQWSFVADALTIIPPYLSLFTGNYLFQLGRLVRVRYVAYYKKDFCSNLKSNIKSLFLRLTVILLWTHVLCCLYIKGVCEGGYSKVKTHFRQGNATLSMATIEENCVFQHRSDNEKHWYHFYIFSLGSLITRHAGQRFAGNEQIDYDTLMSVVFEMSINYGLYVIDLIITSKVVCNVFVKLRKLYRYDYSVRELLHYLSDAGVSPALLKMVSTYTAQLWERQKGTWIPELALTAPQCLREDIMCSLYLHHLQGPTLFRNVPHYFLRQLAARFRRTVIFPDKHIVKTGDILPYVFFINEGEVEKYYLDAHTGERRLMSLLTTNGHFGVFPGIFPNTPFQCGYYTRTVVDLVYLRSEDWQTLLESYPRIRKIMLESARQMGVELGVHDAFFQ